MVARTDELSADMDFSLRFAPLVTEWTRLSGSVSPQFTIAVNSVEGNFNLSQSTALSPVILVVIILVGMLWVLAVTETS